MPLSLATLVTGIGQALGTAWGLLRHYWILLKLMLTVLATVVLLLKLGPIGVRDRRFRRRRCGGVVTECKGRVPQ